MSTRETRQAPRRRFAALAVCLATLGGAPAAAEDGAEEIDLAEIVRRPTIGNYRGYAEFKMAHYGNARRIWEALDARGFGEAAFNLGNLYEDGLGVPRDMARALAYYHRGAELGSDKAAFRLGYLYWFGVPDVPRDREKARPYLTRAAENGDRDAERYLREEGRDTVGDDRSPEAIAALIAAAEAGDPRAQTRLAWHHEAGRGVPRDLARAADWFQRAAEAGDGEAMYALSVMHATGAGRPRDATLAARWLARSAATGYRPAIDDLQRQR